MPSNYPPGVNGGEYEIAGADYEHETTCPACGHPAIEEGYMGDRWVFCEGCGTLDLPPAEPDPDRQRDEERY